MDAKQVAAAESLYRTATRLQRIGLIVDRTALSPAQRRAAFALQCLTANCPEEEETEPERAPDRLCLPERALIPPDESLPLRPSTLDRRSRLCRQ